MKGQTNHLLFFIALSLFIHLAWLLASNRPLTIEMPSNYQDSLVVHITEPGNKINSATVSKSVPITAEKPVSTVKQHPLNSSKNNDDDEKQKLFRQQARIKVIAHIRQRLAKNFEYPRLALSKGWQGRVLLGFNVNQDGGIHNIYIIKSSGYHILDNSAVSSLSKIGKVHLLETQFLDQQQQLELPVIFQLKS